jgi:AraC-like DNA-binding protein
LHLFLFFGGGFVMSELKNSISADNSERDCERANPESKRYNIAGVPAYIGKMFAESGCGAPIGSHRHHDFELALITRGELIISVNGCDIRREAGQGVFINSNRLHRVFAPSKIERESECECEGVSLIFSPLLSEGNERIRRELIAPLINNRAFGHALLSREISWTKEVSDLVLEARDVCATVENAQTAALELPSLLCRILVLLCNNMPSEAAADTIADYNLGILKEMTAFIRLSSSEKISLSDISAAGRVCRSKCGVLFKDYLRCSPMDYLTAYRLRKAAKLLSDTSASMNEIAAHIGFAGASYFAETFRKRYNCSPSEYRESRRP